MSADPGRVAVARFAIAALSLYVKDSQSGLRPGMSLRQIAQAIIDAEPVTPSGAPNDTERF